MTITLDVVVEIFLFLMVGFFFIGFYGLKNRSKLAEKMQKVSSHAIKEKKDVFRLVTENMVQLAKRLGWQIDFKTFDCKLFLAGRPFKLTAEEFIGAWIIVVAAAIVAGFACASSGIISPFFAFLLTAVIAVLPRLTITSSSEKGRSLLGRQVMDLLLQLELGVTAGLTPVRVLEWASQNDTMLATLLKSMVKEVSMGRLTYVIFSRLADDYDVDEAREVAVSLKQAEIQGLAIGQVLTDLSRDLRQSKEMSTEIKVVKLKPSVEAVLTFSMMIGAMTLMAGPMIAENLGSIGTMLNGN